MNDVVIINKDNFFISSKFTKDDNKNNYELWLNTDIKIGEVIFNGECFVLLQSIKGIDVELKDKTSIGLNNKIRGCFTVLFNVEYIKIEDDEYWYIPVGK